MIPYGHQSVDEADIAAVVDVLRGDWLTQGPAVAAFEEALAAYVGAAHAVAFSSGTAGLHAAMAVGGIGAGDVVAAPSLTFVASANAARYLGAEVRFVDIDEATLNLDLDQVPPGVDALVAVHFAGLPVDLSGLSHRPRLVVEDAAHALGAELPTGPVGNCANSDMCVFSFHPVKAITTGEGGLVTTNSATLADGLRRFRNHGIDRRDQAEPWQYEIAELGYNYRLSDIHAALGHRQLARLDHFIDRRNELAARYDAALQGLAVTLPPGPPSGVRHGRHLYPVRVDGRAEVYRAMRAAGVGVQVHYVPIHRQPLYANASRGDLPATDRAGATLLSLPLHPCLTDAEQDLVIEALDRSLRCVGA